MKKPNIFCLIVDAMSQTYAEDDYNATPFINSLKNKSYVCKNIYSQGPYTCSALTPFYTGKDNLDFGGNFFRGDDCETTSFEALSDAGYDVYNYTQPLIYPRPMHRGINKERYGVSYFFSALWDYRLSFYAEEYKRNSLDKLDYENMIILLEENLKFWVKYLTDAKNNAFEAQFINKYSDSSYDFDGNIKKINEQYDLFKKDSVTYINDLLLAGLDHDLFKIPNYSMLDKVDNDEALNKIKAEFNDFFNSLYEFNKVHNKGNKFVWELVKNLTTLSKEKITGSLRKIHHHKKMVDIQGQIDLMFEQKSNYKNEPLMMSYFEDYKELMKSNKSKKPYFFMMHVSDLHIPEVFFSLDSNSYETLQEELNVMKEYLASLPKDFKGNVIYYLSMRYVDLCVERMFKHFEEVKFFDDSIFMLTADHGSSFGYRPFRECVVNNQYVENYHIPFIIYGKDIVPTFDRKFYTTKDIVKTILALAGVDNKEFTGINVMENKGHDYSIVEYFGQGCPDIRKRKALMVIRDKKFALTIKADILRGRYEILSLFDRKIDESETRNVLQNYKTFEYQYLLSILFARIQEIKKSYQNNEYNKKMRKELCIKM